MASPQLSQKLLERGWKGKKSGRGFYLYQEGRETLADDLSSLLEVKREAAREIRPSEVHDRLVLSLVNEAVRCLDDGIAGVPGREAALQIDIGSVMGFGFPAYRGGVLYWAERLTAGALYQRLEDLSKEVGDRFKPAPGIRARAASGETFQQAVA